MRLILLALTCLVMTVNLTSARFQSNSHEWSLYKRQYGKSYASHEEEVRRFANFMTNKAKIDRHNADKTNTYKMGLNHISDWHQDELDKLNGLRVEKSMLRQEIPVDHMEYLQSLIGDDSEAMPEMLDYREDPNRVSPVKNQGNCGSCWAFGTTGVLEGQQVVRNITKKLVPLSEQNLIDCSNSDNGCDGGLMQNAMIDIKRIGGIEDESDYPYKGEQRSCKFNSSQSVMSDSGAILLPHNNPKALMRTLVKYGPVSAAIYATANFQAYQSGVFTDKTCDPETVNHAILIVGYGTQPEGGDYWIVKNSWGANWGTEGYIKVKRGVNLCNIESMPTIAKF